MSLGAEDLYDEHLEYPEDSPSVARRSRRRRRHAKKPAPVLPAATSPHAYFVREVDARGSSLTLDRLGIYMPPSPAPKKNVVTWNDLDLGGEGIIKGSPQGRKVLNDFRSVRTGPLATVPTPQRPQPLVGVATAPQWQAETAETVLGGSPTHMAVSTPEVTSIPHYTTDYQVQANLQNQHAQLQSVASWATGHGHSPASVSRHWVCAGQYGFEPIFQNQAASTPLAVPTPPAQPAPGCTTSVNAPVPSESSDLDTLLRTLSADAYED
jgi:hypothetical protein